MPNPNTYVLIMGGINYYFYNNSGANPYPGTGSPWTSVATTPFEVAQNQKTGAYWTPQLPEEVEVYGGGPPFRNGSSLIRSNYNNVQATIPIQLKATTPDNNILLLRTLRNALKSAFLTVPPILGVQPNTTSQMLYWDVINAKVQEDASFISDETNRGLIRATMTLTLSPFGGRLSTGETVFTNQTFTNIGSGANSDTQAYPTLAGDLIYEGSPLNITLNVGATTITTYSYLGSVLSRLYNTSPASDYSIDLAPALANKMIKLRVLIRTSTDISANARFQATLKSTNGSGSTTIWASELIASGNASNRVLDMGGLDLSFVRSMNETSLIFIGNATRSSSDGGATTGTIAAVEYLFYYDWCIINGYIDTFSSSERIKLTTFREVTGRSVLPIPQPSAVFLNPTTHNVSEYLVISGTPPRYFAGASLFFAQQAATTATATITATHAPLFRTLRGGA